MISRAQATALGQTNSTGLLKGPCDTALGHINRASDGLLCVKDRKNPSTSRLKDSSDSTGPNEWHLQ
eukprot:1160742-Pelagomonas_calceolata.AAC.7